MLHDRAEDLRHGRAEYAPLLLLAPHTPTEDERANHNLTHLPPARWCEFCVQGGSETNSYCAAGLHVNGFAWHCSRQAKTSRVYQLGGV
eukprot:1184955-Amphidinium_carterae.3